MNKAEVRKAEVGWSPRKSKEEARSVVQSGLSSAIYQSIANTAAHNIKDGSPPAAKVDHQYLKPLEVGFVCPLSAHMHTLMRPGRRLIQTTRARALCSRVADGTAGERTAPTIVSCR